MRKQVMGFGLRVLNWVSGRPAMEQPHRRRRLARMLYGASRAGFYAAGAASRPFKALQKLSTPQRLGPAAGDLLDLTPTEEQAMIQDAMARFAADALRPAAFAADEACTAPDELLTQATELGIAAMNVPEALGGAGSERSAVTNALVAEALGHGDLGLAVACLAPAGVAAALTTWGDEQQQAAYLPAFAGDKPPVAAIAVMESQPLFDPFRLQTRARRDGDGWVLEGEKRLVPNAARAELFLIAAALDDGSPAVFVVESGSSGLTVAPDPGMGLRAAALGRVRLEGVRLPAAARLGGDTGLDYAEFIAASRLAWSALAAGTAQAVLDYVIPYTNDRVAFGEPVSHKQGVAFMVANIGIETGGLRLATWRAAARAAAGQPFAREAALARNLCVRHGMQIGADGVQLLGGHGFVKEHPVERWFRDLRAAGFMEGGVML